MVIQNKIGNLSDFNTSGKAIDWISLEWYEAGKTILRKTTQSGKEIQVRFLNKNPALTEGDVLFADDSTVIAITILTCDCIVIHPKDMFEMASVCYEIGNKHLPLFYEAEALLIPTDLPLLRLLIAQGYAVKEEKRKLLHPLKTTVSPHAGAPGETLFSRIMKITTPAP